MNKYTKVYLSSLNKQANMGFLKPLLSKGVSAVSSAAQKALPIAGKAISDFSAGTIQGLQSMGKGYRVLGQSNMPLKQKITTGLSNTFSSPWNTGKAILSGKPISSVNAKDIGTMFGVAAPGMAGLNAVDKTIDAVLPESPDTETTPSQPTNSVPSNSTKGNIWEELNNRNLKYR
jgi:hypothetical protein